MGIQGLEDVSQEEKRVSGDNKKVVADYTLAYIGLREADVACLYCYSTLGGSPVLTLTYS